MLKWVWTSLTITSFGNSVFFLTMWGNLLWHWGYEVSAPALWSPFIVSVFSNLQHWISWGLELALATIFHFKSQTTPLPGCTYLDEVTDLKLSVHVVDRDGQYCLSHMLFEFMTRFIGFWNAIFNKCFSVISCGAQLLLTKTKTILKKKC